MKTSILAVLLFTVCTTAWAGKEVGNGGGAWVCRETSGDLRWIQLIDFFEAQNEFALTVPESPLNYTDQLPGITAKVQNSRANPIFIMAFKKHLRNVLRNVHWISGAAIQRIDDALYHVQPRPSSCASGTLNYEQIANYTDYGAILIDQELFSSLTPTQQAGLIVHEAIYAMYRERDNDQDSLKSRKVVGYLFSDQSVYQYDSILKFESPLADQNFCDLCAIDFEADQVWPMRDGVALVQRGNRFGYIDSNGGILLPLIYDKATEMMGGVAFVEMPGFRGFVDKSGKQFPVPSSVPEDFSNWYWGFENGVAIGGRYPDTLALDLTGRTLFTVLQMWEPSEGMIAYSTAYDRTSNSYQIGYMDLNGSVVIQPRFQDAAVFKNGVARVLENGVVKFIDKTGHEIDLNGTDEVSKERKFLNQLSTRYPMSASHGFGDSGAPYYCDSPYDDRPSNLLGRDFRLFPSTSPPGFPGDYNEGHGYGSVIGDFNDGRAAVLYTLPGRFGDLSGPALWAFIDSSGKFVTQPIFEKVGPYSQGLAPVQKPNAKFGFIDTSGTYVVYPKFDAAFSFHDGFALVRMGTRWGFINRDDLN